MYQKLSKIKIITFKKSPPKKNFWLKGEGVTETPLWYIVLLVHDPNIVGVKGFTPNIISLEVICITKLKKWAFWAFS